MINTVVCFTRKHPYRDFDQLALDMLDQCFEHDSGITQTMIRRTLDQRFKHQSCIQLADAAQSRKIMSHKCCMIVVDEIWNGIISPDASIFLVLMSLCTAIYSCSSISLAFITTIKKTFGFLVVFAVFSGHHMPRFCDEGM